MHVTLGHLREEVVESSEYCVIIYSWLQLEHWLYLIRNAFRSVRTDQDTEIGHSNGLQGIKFLMQSILVSTTSL